MLRINPINNVKYTLNNKISFTSGVQTNYGIEAPSPKSNMVEGNILTGFFGTVVPFFSKVDNRAKSIEKEMEQTKLSLMA